MSTPVVPADLRQLAAHVRAISRTLSWIVSESRLIPTAVRPSFSKLLPDIQQRLEVASTEIEGITPGDDKYALLQLHGLVGSHLLMKTKVGKRASDELAGQGQAVAPTKKKSSQGSGLLGRLYRVVLGWINSLLGSLEKAFPALGAVKEFKECIELTGDFANAIDAPPRSVLP